MSMLKPSGCTGCPFEHHGKYFTPDTIVPGSSVLLIAQNPGPDEEAGRKLINRNRYAGASHNEYEQVQPAPLIGATGKLLNEQFLPLSGLQRGEVSLANTIRCRPGHSLGLLRSDELPPITVKMKLESSKADIIKALKHCRDTYLKVPPSTKVIVAMGRYSMFTLSGVQNEETEYAKKQGVVESWRGYFLNIPDVNHWRTIDTSNYHDTTVDSSSNVKLYTTMHIAALFKGDNKKYYHAVLNDFAKLKLLLNGTWPKPLPTWHTTPPVVWPTYSAFDTEYIPEGNILIRWSLCDTRNNLYCVESDNTRGDRIYINDNSTVLIQNALADIAHLSNIIDISTVQIEDLMLAHSVLWTGEPHSLNYIASMAGAFNRYKHLSYDNPQLYSALDAYEPMHIWRYHMMPEFKADRQSWQLYKQYRLPLIQIINKAQMTGVKVDTARLSDVQHILQDKLYSMQERARELTGNANFKLGGQTHMKEVLYG